MLILDLGTGPSRPTVGKKSSRIFLGFGLLIAVIGIGSTFASTISINSGQDIEFGQGVQQSIFCGGTKSITVTPFSTYANRDDNDTTFGLTGIKVSEIPDDCSGKNFVIKVYGANGIATPLVLARNNGSTVLMPLANVWWANGCPESDAECDQSDYVLDDGQAFLSISSADYAPAGELATVDSSPDSFTVFFASNPTSSNSVNKISIETQDDVFGLEQCIAQQVCVAENG